MRSQAGSAVHSFMWCIELPACTCADSKCLPSTYQSCRNNISHVLLIEEFSEVLKIIIFLQFVHASLKEG